MSKRLRMFIIVCTVLIVIGACLAGVGVMLGATGNINYNYISWNLDDDKGSFHLGGSSPESQSGFSGDIVKESIKIKEPVQVIKTKVGLGEIHFIQSDEFKVEYTYDKGFGKPDISITEGTLAIVDKFGKGGVDLEAKKWTSFKDNEGISYKIYYPKGTKVELIDMDNNIGEIAVSNIQTETLNIRLDVGNIKLVDLTAGNVDVDLSLGDIKMENIQTNSLSAISNMGDIAIDGILKGKNTFATDMGDIKVETTLEKDYYSLELDTKLGDIKVDGENIGGLYQVNNSADNTIDAQSSAGDIKVKFQ